MSKFQFHTPASAPEASRPLLDKVSRQFGFVPSLLGGLANAPAALEGYLTLAGIFERSSLSRVEQQVVLLAVSVENNCEFCVSAHSFIARNMVKVDADTVTALRSGGKLPNPRLDALATFVRQVVIQRGWVDPAGLQAFEDAGYSRSQALDVILGVSLKTLSNYANHLLGTPVDSAFEAERWHRAA
jgi:uncharacterized peroxidase-related enzyme